MPSNFCEASENVTACALGNDNSRALIVAPLVECCTCETISRCTVQQLQLLLRIGTQELHKCFQMPIVMNDDRIDVRLDGNQVLHVEIFEEPLKSFFLSLRNTRVSNIVYLQ